MKEHSNNAENSNGTAGSYFTMIREEPGSAPGTVHVFFPMYNEGQSAANLALRIRAICMSRNWEYHIVAVDDGSTDDSLEYLLRVSDRIPITILKHNRNMGLRTALFTGLNWLHHRAESSDYVAMMDGDDTHNPEHLPEMVDRLNAGDNVVIASRYRRGATIDGVAWYRQIFSLGAVAFGMLLFHVRGVRDYTCGYRMFKGSTLHRLMERYADNLFEIKGYGFICSLELLVKLGDVAPRIGEIPMRLQYDRKEAPSKMDAIKTIKGHFALYLHRRRTRKTR